MYKYTHVSRDVRHIRIHIYTYVHLCIYIYIHIYTPTYEFIEHTYLNLPVDFSNEALAVKKSLQAVLQLQQQSFLHFVASNVGM